jgi:hypothetical protein
MKATSTTDERRRTQMEFMALNPDCVGMLGRDPSINVGATLRVVCGQFYREKNAWSGFRMPNR